jgi:uncharacterized protein YPO0396
LKRTVVVKIAEADIETINKIGKIETEMIETTIETITIETTIMIAEIDHLKIKEEIEEMTTILNQDQLGPIQSKEEAMRKYLRCCFKISSISNRYRRTNSIQFNTIRLRPKIFK